jgi:hypothetical protein
MRKNSYSFKKIYLLKGRIFWLFIFLLITSLSIFYVFQINREISERYSLEKYEKALNELSEKNRVLSVAFLEKSSLDNIENLLATLNFEEVKNTSYIQVLGSQVVIKEK